MVYFRAPSSRVQSRTEVLKRLLNGSFFSAASRFLAYSLEPGYVIDLAGNRQ